MLDHCWLLTLLARLQPQPGIGDLDLVHLAREEVVLDGLRDLCGVLGLDGVWHGPELLSVVVLVLVLVSPLEGSFPGAEQILDQDNQ